jgi:hypothetical protein
MKGRRKGEEMIETNTRIKKGRGNETNKEKRKEPEN